MTTTNPERIAKIETRAKAVTNWKRNPDNFDAAAHAALYYARRDGAPMIVVPGNSYGRAVYHVATEGTDLARFGIVGSSPVAIVNPDGTVFRAVAN